ncbi:TonB-dependent receptor [Granulicella paludicola]|uniref:TonB-dependent receptor n=1 Tax=Granulicella paludicola TaxID=474951 RepID=UPI0021DFBA8F|nr:TonB-dependent receptor [Granulicella paludicola]
MSLLSVRKVPFSSIAKGVAFLFVLALAVRPAFAQITGQGAISGTVTDPTSAVVPSAVVEARDTTTNVVTTRNTTSSGYYTISPLPPGEYVLTVKAPGFEALKQEHITVNAIAVTTVNPVLKIGSANETVDVTTAPPNLQTSNATLGGVIENRVYSELPVTLGSGVARDPTAFAALQNGVQSGGRSGDFDGTNANENEMYVEGVPMTTVDSQGDNRKLNQNLSIEAVEQTQVQTSGAGAQYQGVGSENFSIKQGTNKFHGNANLFMRNGALDAWSFFAKATTVPTVTGGTAPAPKAPDHQTEMSFSLGGPVVHNKLFFFVNYDKYHYSNTANPKYQSIPTLQERAGNFTAFPYKIYDPTTYASCTASNGGVPCVKQFDGMLNGIPTLNVIPASEISPIWNTFQKNLPQPINTNLTNNYLYGYPTNDNNWGLTGRLDYTLSPRHSIALISTSGKKIIGPYDYGSTTVLPYPYVNGTIVTELTTTDIIKHTWTISPNKVNQLRYGLTRFWAPVKAPTAGDKTFSNAALGIGNTPAGQASDNAPAISFSGGIDGTTGYSSPSGFHEGVNTYTIADDFTWTKGQHNLTIGGDFQWLQFNQSVADSASTPMTYTMAAASTGEFYTAADAPSSKLIGTLNPASGGSYASYLIGAVSSTSIYSQNFSTLGGRFKAFSPYVQDDWKVTRNLTFNLGLRWDLYTPYKEVHDHWSTLSSTLTNPATGTPGALEFIGHGNGTCNCDTVVHTHYTNVGPRVGVAYQYTPKDVVRASFSLMYTHNGGVGGSTGAYNGTGQVGLTGSAAFASSVQGEQPAFYLNPNLGAYSNTSIPSYSAVPTFSSTANAGNYINTAGVAVTANSISYADPYLSGRPPYTEAYNFGLQHAFTNKLTLSVDYVGNQSHFLAAGLRGPQNNELDAKYEILGPLLAQLPGGIDTKTGQTYLAEAQAILPGINIPYSNYGGPSATIGQMLKAYPQYSSVSDTWGNTGSANYNSLQLTLKQLEWHGLSATLNYTFAKTIDDLAIRSRYPIPANVIDGGVGVTKAYRLDRTVSTTDIPNNLHLYGLYALPIGARDQWGGKHFLTRNVLGGWAVSFIYTKTSGSPLTISGLNCKTPDSCFAEETPGYTGDPHINGSYGKGKTVATLASTHYLDINAFVATPGNAGYNFSNGPRTQPYHLFNLGTYDVDTGLKRSFPIYRTLKFTFQADIFNLTNHVQFGGLGVATGSPQAFGILTSQGNSARSVQFAGKFNF